MTNTKKIFDLVNTIDKKFLKAVLHFKDGKSFDVDQLEIQDNYLIIKTSTGKTYSSNSIAHLELTFRG